MSISSVTPTLAGAPETLLRSSAPDVRANQLPVDPSQLVNPRQAVDGRPQTIQKAEPSDHAVKHKGPEDQPQDEQEDQAGLTRAEQQEVSELKQRDQEVRSHEQAHLAAAGPYALSGAQFNLAIGPDGKPYATGGEVKIDTAPVPDDPAATIAKMQAVRGAAMAPQNPSAADRQVAAQASREISKAQHDLTAEQRDGQEGPESPVSQASPVSRASSAYAQNEPPPNDSRRTLFDFKA